MHPPLINKRGSRMHPRNPKTDQAILLMKEKGLTAYAAAKELNLPYTTLKSRLLRDEAKELAQGAVLPCPTCGTHVPKSRLE
jgi:hypothetical protein